MLAITENFIDASARRLTIGIGTRRAGDPLLSPLALQRWESEGGAVTAPGSRTKRSLSAVANKRLVFGQKWALTGLDRRPEKLE